MKEIVIEETPEYAAVLEDHRLALTASAFLGDLLTELATAQMQHAPLNSLYEAYAVLLEEVDEFWQEVRQKREERVYRDVRTELLQIAAMAWRAAIDCRYEDPD